jgi:hypothetical protein
MKRFSESEEWALKCIERGCDDDHEVYEFMGDLSFKNGNSMTAMEWYLKHVNKTKDFNTEYIMENLIRKIPREDAVTILRQIFNTSIRLSENAYFFIQIGKLLLEI